MRRALALLVFAFALFVTKTASADVTLYTIGPGDYLYARYGHSLICEDGTCYDYGVADRQEPAHIVWTAMRGEPSFVPIAVPENVVLDFAKSQGRQIDKQRLPLTPEESKRLIDGMKNDVATKRSYAYHAYSANCSTQIRDRIDAATNGRLHAGWTNPNPARFRELAEEGLSGRLGELTLLAFLLGAPNDRVPDGWEIMFLPAALRDGVLERLGAPIEKIAEREAIILPTSRAVGRIALFALALALFVASKRRRGRFFVGFVLGTMGTITAMTAALVVWPEFQRNWALLLLLPIDFALPYLPRRVLVPYARARIAIAALLGVLEITGVIAQPLLPLVALIVLPFAGILRTLRPREEATEPAVAATASTAG